MALAAFFWLRRPGGGPASRLSVTPVIVPELQFELWSDEAWRSRRKPNGRVRGFVQDMEHLIRLAVVMAIALTAFMILRAACRPTQFWTVRLLSRLAARGDRVAANCFCRSRELRDLPSDVVALKNEGKHAGVNCEACHGALAKHAEDPGTLQPPKLDTASLRPLP